MRNPLLAPDLRELVAERSGVALREFFSSHHPADAAELIDDLLTEEAIYVLGLFDSRVRSEVFSYLDPPLQESITEVMDRQALAAMITHMSHDERADLISRLPKERAEQIFPLLAQAEREDIRRLVSYADGTAGAVMTTDYAALPAEATAASAIERLRLEAPDKETIYYCYILDSERHLIGFVSLKDLILAPPSRLVRDIMQKEVVSALADEDQEKAATKMREYDLLALPLVDPEGRIVGIITHDDVLDVIVDEATEDVYRLGGMEPLADSYLRTPFFTMWGKRGAWLAVLFLGGYLTTTALGKYEESFSAVPALVLFIPLIISAGGNCGSQSATLITRALALGEVQPIDWFRVLWHEILMGFALGGTLAFFGFLRAMMLTETQLGISPWIMGKIVALGVAVVVLWGNMVGALLPLALKRIGLDPALMSNPFLASLVDVTGILVYFSIAGMFLS